MFVSVPASSPAALLGAGYYVWSVPEQKQARMMVARLRELRAEYPDRARRTESSLLRSEHRGAFAFLGDFVAWVGVLRRLQELIAQADLKYRAADVFAVSLVMLRGGVLPARAVRDSLCISCWSVRWREWPPAADRSPTSCACAAPAASQVRAEPAGRHRPVHPHHARRPQHPQRAGDHRHGDAGAGPPGVPQEAHGRDWRWVRRWSRRCTTWASGCPSST